MSRFLVRAFLSVLVLGFLNVRRLFAAYLDPNTGGMLFQLLAVLFGFFSGFILLFSSRIKMAFFRILRLIKGSKPDETLKER